MGRLNDWPERLNDTINDWRMRPFVWGKSDCVSFCLACDAAMNGKPSIKLRKYSTKAAAARQIAKAGGGGLVEAVDAKLSRKDIKAAQRGDLAAIETGEGPAVVIVLGDCLVGMGPDGLVFPPIDAAIAAWGL